MRSAFVLVALGLAVLLAACGASESKVDRVVPFIATAAATESPTSDGPATGPTVGVTSGAATTTPTRTPGIPYPDPARTPGDALPVTLKDVCKSGYTRTVRDVSNATKERIYAEYGITRQRLPNEFEMDHLIPLALGGSNEDANLWPMPIDANPGAYQKDKLEVALAQLACSGSISLEAAQREIASDWYRAYLKYVLKQGP